MASILTIGVYGFDADTFLHRLQAAQVGVLLDVRQRRGVRGAEYAWANARRLQRALTVLHSDSRRGRLVTAPSRQEDRLTGDTIVL